VEGRCQSGESDRYGTLIDADDGLADANAQQN
jgi:hypothetical protein